MGAAESRSQGSSTGSGEGSSTAKLAFAPGTQPLLVTPVFTLRDAFFGKRPVSAFTYDPAQFVLDNNQEFLPKAIKKLKTIRHPSVLRFIDCKASSKGFHLITEQVIPLTPEYLEDITEDEILIGLYDIMVALQFLHSQCRVSHNNVQLGSIFVSNGRWVLGGMEFTGTAAESMETGLTSLLAKELIPPELQGQASKMSSQTTDLTYAVDIWQYGKLVESLIQDGLLRVKPNALPLERMLNNDPRKRPTGDIILESDLFGQNNAVSVVRYCRLKGLDKAQNAQWSQTLLPRLYLLSPSIMEKFVLPQLLTQEFFAAEGFDKLYRTLFTPQPPQPLVSEALYKSEVMPFMVKLWTYRQADIRMTILRLFEVYLKAVVMGEGGSEVLGQIILPEILTGLQDADTKVYLASLCGLATAIPYALLVSTLVETESAKQKFPVKMLYEQTLVPQIMAFWITEDCTQESKAQLVEVVMGMWCSIYTLGLQNHPSVKDISSTLTLTLVSLLKLSSVNQRVELISNSCTKHCTNELFCISGLLKFLPQFLLDDDSQVREAAARAITTVANQTLMLLPGRDSASESQESGEQRYLTVEGDSNGHGTGVSTASTPSSPSLSSANTAQVSKIRQYCEKQQTLLPPRRSIFSRSTFGGEKSLSSNSLKSPNGVDSSRRSSTVSQDSYSEQGSMRTPSILTPSRTRAGSLSGEPAHRDNVNPTVTLEPQARLSNDKLTKPSEDRAQISLDVGDDNDIDIDIDMDVETQEATTAEELQAADEIELMKALESAKAEMKMRQLPVTPTTSKPSSSRTHSSAAFGWDAAGDDDGDDWDNDDLTLLTSPVTQSFSSTVEQQPVEDEQTRLKREEEKAEKQEQLKLKRDQKQKEMQAKREARKQQLAEKQTQKSSNGLGLGAVKTTTTTTTVGPALKSPTVGTPVASKPVSGRSMIQLVEESVDGKDDWDLDGEIDMTTLGKQADSVEDELFQDMGVDYKAPAYVGGTLGTAMAGSTTSISSSVSSSMTLSNSTTAITSTKTTHSPTMSASTTTTITGTTTGAVLTTTTPSTTLTFATKVTTAPVPVSGEPLSLQSADPTSRGSSPAATPKRVASPLMRTTSNSSVNTLSSNGGQNNGYNKALAVAPTAAAVVPALPPTSSTATTTKPSLALQVDDAALEDSWGDDWD
ncbi:MAG: hypothetical protein J3Q66DRAFT_322863 [Benniella sp.]|nr:MAG: hypothetical protein J3Q66DRAFT_322863 [Benniella sp.]